MYTKEMEVDDRAYAYIAAAIDFLYTTSEDMLRQRTRHVLGLDRNQGGNHGRDENQGQ